MRSVISVVVMLAVVLSFAARTGAQSSVAVDFEQAFAPDFLKRDAPTFKSMLALDSEQTSIVESLLHDYNERFEQGLRGVREELRDAQAAMGFEDPEIDQQRENIRAQIAALFEEMQAELENLSPGSNAGEFRAKYEAQVQALQTRLQQLQPSPAQADQIAKLFEDASVKLEQWRAEKRANAERFASDAKAILRSEQQARWPALERRLLRERTLGRGRLQGESVDLVALVNDLKLDAAQKSLAAAAIADYEAALDAALRTRNELSETSERAILQAVQAADQSALTGAIERITEARVALRNVNDDFAARLSAALGDASAQATAAYLQRGYPLVSRDTQTLRLIKAAQELPGLAPEQSQALADLRTAYEAELAAKNEQVLAAVREHEPAQVTHREVRRLLAPTPDQEDAERDRGVDGMQAAFEQRAEMGKKYDSQLQSLLGPELYERLPRNSRIIRPGDNVDDRGADQDDS